MEFNRDFKVFPKMLTRHVPETEAQSTFFWIPNGRQALHVRGASKLTLIRVEEKLIDIVQET